MNKKKQIIFSALLVLFLTAVSLVSYLVIESSREAGSLVRVSIDGKTVSQFPLDIDGEYELNGGTNILVIKDGKAYMKYASCPDGLCKRQGKISMSGERIVCLPNKVIIEAIKESTLDAVVR